MRKMQLKTVKQRQFNTFAWAVFLVLILFAAALPGLEFPGVGKLYPFRVVLPFVVLAVAFYDRKYGAYSAVQKNTILLFLFMSVYGCVTVLWAPEKLTAIKQLVGYAYGFFLVIVLFRLIRERSCFYRVMMLIAWIMIIIMLMGVLEGFTGHYFFEEGWEDLLPYAPDTNIHYPVVCFGNPNDMVFAAFAFMPFINLSANALYKGKFTALRIGIKVLYFVLYCMVTVLASCRMGILLIPIAVVVNVCMAKRSTFKTLAVAAIVVACGFGVLLKWDSFLAFFEQDARVEIWKNILKNAEHFFFFGTGPRNSFVAIEGVEYAGRLINPHFWFLEILTEFGIFVFLALMAGYFALMRAAFRRIGKAESREKYTLSKTAFKVLLYFFPMSIMSSSLSVSPFFWLIAALVLLAVELSGKSAQNGGEMKDLPSAGGEYA